MRLDWVPALDRPDLLAGPTRSALQALADAGQVDVSAVEVAEIDPSLADTATLVAASGLDLADMANCIVIDGARGGHERVCAALVLGTTRADVNKVIRKRLDVRKCSFMSMDEAVSRTGMEHGGITPIGVPSTWPVLVDSRVVERAVIVIGSGLRRSKLRLPGRLAAHLCGVEVIEGLALEV